MDVRMKLISRLKYKHLMLLLCMVFTLMMLTNYTILNNKVVIHKQYNSESVDGFYQLGNKDIYIFSAYLDLRLQHRIYLNLIGMQARSENVAIECTINGNNHVKEIFYKGGEPIYPKWPSKDLKYLAYMYTFKIYYFDTNGNMDKGGDGSIMCRHSNSSSWIIIPLITVRHTPRDSNVPTLAVCVKAAIGNLNEMRLIEWIEFQRLLGINKIAIYDSAVTGQAINVLDYYTKQGLVDQLPFNYLLKMHMLMKEDPIIKMLANENLVFEQGYLVSINDCLYRYASQYEYIMVIDLDELIIPHGDDTLIELLARAKKYHPNAAAYTFETAWHLESFGPSSADEVGYLHTQKYRKRTHPMKSQPKSIFHTDRIVTANWHTNVLITNIHGVVGNMYLPSDEYGFVHHFRKICKYEKEKCEQLAKETMVDEAVISYYHGLKKAVQTTLRFLLLI